MVDAIIQRRWMPRFKVLYLIAVSVAVYVIPSVAMLRPVRWIMIPSLLLLQAMLLAACVPMYDVFRPVLRLKWLFLFLAVCYAFLPGSPEDIVWTWRPVAMLRS